MQISLVSLAASLMASASAYPIIKPEFLNTHIGDTIVFNKTKRSDTFHPIKLDFNIVKATKKLRKDRTNRLASQSNAVILLIENQYSLYVANIALGTPQQQMQVQLDTGSSDLWVPAVGTTDTYSVYSDNSTTYKLSDNQFNIGYADGTSASGIWSTDVLHFSDNSIKNMWFGYATKQNTGQGVLGIGLRENEASAWLPSGAFSYNNFPYQLKAEKLIKKAAYSLFLNSKDAHSGSVLFGAVDTKKYVGDMKMNPIIKIDANGHESETETGFFIQLDNISSGNDTLTVDYPKGGAALLDSGSTLIYAPNKVANIIGHKYGKYNRAAGGYVTSCKTKGDPLVFTFGNGVKISVPFEDTLYDLSKDSPIFTPEDCLVGVVNSGSDTFLLGDAFLRSAYVLYDLEEKKVGVAQAIYTDETNPQII